MAKKKTQDEIFDAILSKNIIARELASFTNSGEINIKRVLECLNTIEGVIGHGNQPSIEDVYRTNLASSDSYPC